jgi:hypothetical protein
MKKGTEYMTIFWLSPPPRKHILVVLGWASWTLIILFSKMLILFSTKTNLIRKKKLIEKGNKECDENYLMIYHFSRWNPQN